MSLDYLKSWFGKTAPSACATQVAAVVTPLVRSEATLHAYAVWQNTAACKIWCQRFEESYKHYNGQCKMAQASGNILFLQKRCSKSFEMAFDENLHNASDFIFLFDLFRDRLLAKGYQLQVSDCRTYDCSATSQATIERHYLKPIAQRLQFGKIPQYFGNISLTLHATNGQPTLLKCCAAHYRDFGLFEPVLPLAELVDCLCNTATLTQHAEKAY